MGDINIANKDSRPTADQEAAAAAQALFEQQLVDQHGLQPTGSRVTVDIPGIPLFQATVEGIEEDLESDLAGSYLVRLRTDDGELYIVGPNDGQIRPAAQGDGTKLNPLFAEGADDVYAAVPKDANPKSSRPKKTAHENGGHQQQHTKQGLVSRYVLQVILIAMLGSCAYFSWRDVFNHDNPDSVSTRQAGDAQQAAEAQRRILKKSVVEMASKANAVTDWAANLADGRNVQSSILTAELHKQWVINRPILFLGNIQDIAINSDATYQVIVEHAPFSTANTIFFPDIRMNLRCPELVAVPLIQAAKKGSASLIGANTAITAVIESVITTREINSKGDTSTVMTGLGKCLDAIYLTERISWP